MKNKSPYIGPTIVSIFCLSFFFAGSGNAQLTKSSRWLNEFSQKYDYTIDVVYNRIDSIETKLDIYWPKDSSARVPVLVWIHGGGWRRLSKDSASGQLTHYLEKGWGVVNVDYRLTGTALAPAAVIDCRCALHWVVKNAEKYRYDPQSIYLSGSSAGGHLALMTGMLRDNDPLDTLCSNDLPYRIRAVINWFGITDVNDLLSGPNRKGYAVKWLGERNDRDLIAKKVSPLSHIRKDLPPIFTVHGDADTTVPYSHAVRLHKALGDQGIANRMVTIPGGFHGKFSKKENEDIYKAIDEFLIEIGSERKK